MQGAQNRVTFGKPINHICQTNQYPRTTKLFKMKMKIQSQKLKTSQKCLMIFCTRSSNELFEFKPVSENDVTKFTDKMNVKKVVGVDKLSVKLLKAGKTPFFNL